MSYKPPRLIGERPKDAKPLSKNESWALSNFLKVHAYLRDKETEEMRREHELNKARDRDIHKREVSKLSPCKSTHSQSRH